MTDPLRDMLRELAREVVREELAKPQLSARLTVEDYAERWSISQSTVRAAIRTGRLAVERVGRAVRIPADARIGSGRRRDHTERVRLALLKGGSVR